MSDLKRYWIFVYLGNDPAGGAYDLLSCTDDLQKALDISAQNNKVPELDCHILDTNTKSIITNRD